MFARGSPKPFDIASANQSYQITLRQGGCREYPDVLAVPQHGYAIGQGKDFLEIVGDVDERCSPLTLPPDELE